MSSKRVPLRKKFPGEHVMRTTFWYPSGASVGFEGKVEREAAELLIATVCAPERLTPELLADMARIRAVLLPKDKP